MIQADVRDLAERLGYSLTDSYAYSDSQTDLPMLDVVGHPVAVNPDKELARIAREREWPVLRFNRPVAMRRRRPQVPEFRRISELQNHERVVAGTVAASVALALGIALIVYWRQSDRVKTAPR